MVVAEDADFPNDSVARNNEGDRILSDRVSNSPRSPGLADTHGKIFVRNERSARYSE